MALSCTTHTSVGVYPQSLSLMIFPVNFTLVLFFRSSALTSDSQVSEVVCRNLNSEHSRLLRDVFFRFYK